MKKDPKKRCKQCGSEFCASGRHEIVSGDSFFMRRGHLPKT